ncbi:putative transcription factor Trihelix family [Helianthus annuus]|uniref:Transcription factor Trihelix family n=1 Tax=Helianthus annuus TaxID=4232 RepID=A0A9K3JCW8_HELAN|nr:putative transcription factor Trihelix family [Helianthus annuus]KAJ0933792.1 putative transcription factor Trihelix family [Helianthus annuus]
MRILASINLPQFDFKTLATLPSLLLKIPQNPFKLYPNFKPSCQIRAHPTGSKHHRRPVRNNNNFNEYDNDEFEEENVGLNQRYSYQLNNNNNINNNDEDDDEDDEEEEDDENEYRHGYYRGVDTGESSRRHQKKRRLDNIVSNYEYAPRVPDRLSDEWSDNATFVLVEVWGDRYLELGRKSLRTDDWVEVAEKVSEMCKMEIDESRCRKRLESLKKKYKKEKAKVVTGGYNGKWGFFKKMDMLLSPKKQHNGLPCGVDSGEYVFMNTKVYLDQSNALDEMRDSPCESEDDDDDGEDEWNDEDGEGFRLLAESVQNFGEIYEKIEGRKRQQTMELEKMRMDFQRELEIQKKQILERAQAEIAKIREGDDEDVNSVENLSG